MEQLTHHINKIKANYHIAFSVQKKLLTEVVSILWYKNLRASLVAQWLRVCCQCKGRGFEPWSGRIPRATEQLGPWATIAEPARLEPVLRSKRGRDGERPAHHDEEWPLLAAAGGSPRTETKTQHSNQSINQSINE